MRRQRQECLTVVGGVGSTEVEAKEVRPLPVSVLTTRAAVSDDACLRLPKRRTQMRVMRTKEVAGLVGGSAILAAIAISLVHPSGPVSHDVAGGSGDSSTAGAYASPTVPAMTIDPTNLKMGATVTAAKPAETLATSFAAPSLKSPPAAGCVNNGQCP
jgi:hypothetical protein